MNRWQRAAKRAARRARVPYVRCNRPIGTGIPCKRRKGHDGQCSHIRDEP